MYFRLFQHPTSYRCSKNKVLGGRVHHCFIPKLSHHASRNHAILPRNSCPLVVKSSHDLAALPAERGHVPGGSVTQGSGSSVPACRVHPSSECRVQWERSGTCSPFRSLRTQHRPVREAGEAKKGQDRSIFRTGIFLGCLEFFAL